MESPGHVYTKNLHYDELQQFNSVCKPCPNIVSSIVFFLKKLITRWRIFV